MAWMDWKEPLENAFKDVGDISGFWVFDAGPEGFASRFLAERIGEGRIIGVNSWLGFYRTVRMHVGLHYTQSMMYNIFLKYY